MTTFADTDLDPLDEPPTPGTLVISVHAARAGVAADVACLVVAVATGLLLATDSSFVLRPVLATAFTLVVPGWAVLRACRARSSLLVMAGAIALSMAMALLLGEALVLFGDWRWFPVELALAGGSALLVLVSLRRWWLAPHPDRPARRVATRLDRSAGAALVTAIVGVALVAVGAGRTTVSQTSVLGLISTLSGWCWIGFAVILVGLLIAIRADSRWAWMDVGALLFVLNGLPGMIEPSPRFSVAWLHTGFIDQIARHGTLLRGLDARFSWAGFFAAGGLLQRLSGTESLLWAVRYAPVFYNACTMLLLICLARRVRLSRTQTVVAAVVFILFNWIGQDYFSPQATAFLLYLTIVTVVLCAFPANPIWMPRSIGRLIRPEPDESIGLTGRPAALVLAGCYTVALAIAASHQLTPGFLATALLLLAVCGAIRTRLFPVAVALMFLAWLSYGAQAYWSGHLGVLTDSFGQVSTIVDANVGRRAGTTQLARKIVVDGRIVLALIGWAAAGLSLVVSWVRRRTPVALLCLLVAPFPMIVLQPYGGEMVLRVCYFSLPAVALLVAKLIVPATPGRIPMRRVAALAVPLAILVPSFITTRFGNEAFEAISADDAAMNRAMYAIVPTGSVVFVQSRQTPLYSQRVDEVRFRNLPGGSVTDITEAVAASTRAVAGGRRSFIMLTESQESYRIVALADVRGWLSELTTQLLQTGRYTVRAQIGRSILLEIDPR